MNVIATLMAQRKPARENENEATLDLGASFAIAGGKLLECAGRLQLMYENELLPDADLDIIVARRWLNEARKSLAAYDLSRTIAKGRAAMAGGQVTKPTGTAPPIAEVDDDDLNEALDDATSDGEGHITPYYLHRHLAKRGMKIVAVAKDEGEIPDGDT